MIFLEFYFNLVLSMQLIKIMITSNVLCNKRGAVRNKQTHITDTVSEMMLYTNCVFSAACVLIPSIATYVSTTSSFTAQNVDHTPIFHPFSIL